MAIWPRVRAGITVSRCRAAWSASVVARRARRASRRSRTRARRRTRAVSMMSWVVAPQWTQGACSAGRVRRKAATRAGTGMPAAATPAARSAGGMTVLRAAAAIASALAVGMMPSAPWTRARAPSTASMASISAASVKSGPISGSPQKPVQRAPSKGETDIRALLGVIVATGVIRSAYIRFGPQRRTAVQPVSTVGEIGARLPSQGGRASAAARAPATPISASGPGSPRPTRCARSGRRTAATHGRQVPVRGPVATCRGPGRSCLICRRIPSRPRPAAGCRSGRPACRRGARGWRSASGGGRPARRGSAPGRRRWPVPRRRSTSGC